LLLSRYSCYTIVSKIGLFAVNAVKKWAKNNPILETGLLNEKEKTNHRTALMPISAAKIKRKNNPVSKRDQAG